MSSRILHLQTPLECLKESYPSTRLISEVPLCVFGCTAYVHSFGPNQTKFTPQAQACEFVEYPLHQRCYKCFYPSSRKYFVTMNVTFCEERPYRESEESQKGSRVPYQSVAALVQDSKPPRDQGMKNPTEPCTNNTMNENNKSDVAVLENGHTGKLDKYDPSLDLPIALRKALTLPQYRKNIHIALEFPEWKNVVMEEMKALEKNNTWEICALPKGHKSVGCKWVFTLKYKVDGTLDRHKARFTTFVKSQGYNQGHSDHTLFTKVSETRKIAVLIIYVDDIVLSGDDQVARSKEGISVSQRKYTLDLLTETGMLGCRPADIPIEFNCKLGNSDDQVPVDKEQYQRLVGKLIYLSHIRPDIFFVVSVVSQFIKTNKKTIEAYTDSDWIGYVVDRKSTSGYCTFVWGNLVTWRSKKQSVVARSSAEVEYRVMSLGICEEIWLQKVLYDLH
ncbi:reverse transcriptase [Cucumis melo var. makuwa]|uniref:Reverse transcriptase n=1 Tax=Cucumis melo var. makuwa TaxID=1194695 RepID=A0A5A7UAU8_CUCMM|nr:reverse transcriptase [Cucumis melo var. makuwa]TYK01873.1 reverse transcriptase [Cucumis melo var. makuwa]